MKNKLALLGLAALVLTGCGGAQDSAGSSPTTGASPAPGTTLSDPATPPSSSTPTPAQPPTSPLPRPKPTPKPTPPKPVPTAADGTNYKACADARCEVAVRTGTRLPVKKGLGFTSTLVISRVSNGSVDYGATGGCCSISTQAQTPGSTYRMNNLKVLTVAVAGKTAILRLTPA